MGEPEILCIKEPVPGTPLGPNPGKISEEEEKEGDAASLPSIAEQRIGALEDLRTATHKGDKKRMELVIVRRATEKMGRT